MYKFKILLLTIAFATCAAPAFAQRLPFQRSFDVSGPATLDVTTIRGSIAVTVGDPGRIDVAGVVTVRAGWDTPANAVDLARIVADNPPVESAGQMVRLRSPSDAASLRAVTVSYEVRVPRDTVVLAVSESGATTIRDVAGRVSTRTQSGAITLTHLGAEADITTGSGSVSVEDAAGALTVTTSSSGFTGRRLNGGLRLRTSSGSVDAVFAGLGDVDVETGSSAIRLAGVRGALSTVTRSGGVYIDGAPSKAWTLSSGSGSVHVTIDPATAFTVDAVSRSSTVRLVGARPASTVSKGRAAGPINGGGPLVKIITGSGSIDLTTGQS
jgi:hypothetical protein